MTGVVVAENHPLVEELNWQSLLLNKTESIPAQPNDQVLVWQDNRPLALLRPRQNGLEDLILNFDLETGNATNQPAVVLLLHRFIERRRERIKRSEVLNVEQNQTLAPKVNQQPPTITLTWEPPNTSPDAPPMERTTIPLDQLAALRAPIRPGFFAITQGIEETQLQPLAGAVHFADTREGNFNDAGGESDDLTKEIKARMERHSRPDPLSPIWLLAAGLLPAWCWIIFGRPENEGGRS